MRRSRISYASGLGCVAIMSSEECEGVEVESDVEVLEDGLVRGERDVLDMMGGL